MKGGSNWFPFEFASTQAQSVTTAIQSFIDFLQRYPDGMEVVGVAGFVVYIFSFKLVQAEKLDGNGVAYALMNVVAASFVLVSLASAFNLASFLIQISFISIGLYGVVKKLRKNAKK